MASWLSRKPAGLRAKARVPVPRGLLIVVLACCPALSSVSEVEALPGQPARTEPLPRITVDLAGRTFDRMLPFDVPFVIVGTVPEGTVKLAVQYAEVPRSAAATAPEWKPPVPAAWQPGRPSSSGQTFLLPVRDGLDARRTYRFRFTISKPLVFGDERLTEEETIVDGETSRNSHVSADAGLLYAGDIATAAIYIGSNIYFRPVNKRAPLSRNGSFSRRAALTIGLTLTSIADGKNGTRSDLFGHQAVLLGGGLRLTQSIRAGAGALVFKQKNPNPLITKTSAATTPYVSFSFDLDVASLFQRLGW